MSVLEIMAELPKLSRPELEQLDVRLHELLRDAEGASCPDSWGTAMLQLAGTVEGLPPDFAENHNHYLHGTPRR